MISDIISTRSGDRGLREGFQAPIENDTPVAPKRVDLGSEVNEARHIKPIARLFGANLVGITALDMRWHYSKTPDTRDMTPVDNDLPEALSHVIVMGDGMDFDLVETYPSALAGTATGARIQPRGDMHSAGGLYPQSGLSGGCLDGRYCFGYPLAIKVGQGEYGRNQMVLTPKFGPRVRFSKIFTDMPLALDAPARLGLGDYFDGCTLCADACPPKALPFGAPDLGKGNPSTIKGVRKWSANWEAGFSYWAKIRTDCAICMRVRPFNRRGSWLDRLWVWPASGRARWLARLWQVLCGRRARLSPADWWARTDGSNAN